jgi:hypothetical protein
VSNRERDILERAVTAVADEAAKADGLVEEALAAGLPGNHPVTIQAKTLRQELLDTKALLEGELCKIVVNCRTCGLHAHWVEGLGAKAGHWAHAEPNRHGDPVV